MTVIPAEEKKRQKAEYNRRYYRRKQAAQGKQVRGPAEQAIGNKGRANIRIRPTYRFALQLMEATETYSFWAAIKALAQEKGLHQAMGPDPESDKVRYLKRTRADFAPLEVKAPDAPSGEMKLIEEALARAEEQPRQVDLSFLNLGGED